MFSTRSAGSPVCERDGSRRYPWRYLPGDFPPWPAVYQQTPRWIHADVFEDMVYDVRQVLRMALGKEKLPAAAVLDSQTLRSTPESGHRAGYDAGKKVKGRKVHVVVGIFGNLLSVVVIPANAQDRAQVDKLCQNIQEVTGQSVTMANADGGYTGEPAVDARLREVA